MPNQLESKTAVVSGAARGIGAAIAQTFVEQGATVYVTDVNDELGHVFVQQLGNRAHYCHLDVREEAEWQHLMKRIVAEQRRLDIVVNNAGITGFEMSAGPHDPEHVSLSE